MNGPSDNLKRADLDAFHRSTEWCAKEMYRLRMVEEEYKLLTSFLEISQEYDVLDRSVIIRITPEMQVASTCFGDAVRFALDETYRLKRKHFAERNSPSDG